jgi:hypothetical protein
MRLSSHGVSSGRRNASAADNRQRVAAVGRSVIPQQMMVLDGGGQLRIEGGESRESWRGGHALCWMDGWTHSAVQHTARHKDTRTAHKAQDNANGRRHRQVRSGQVTSTALEE